MASLRTLLKETIIDKIIINEIGEASVEPFDYKKIDNTNYLFVFEFNNISYQVKVNFTLIEENLIKTILFFSIPDYFTKEFYNVEFTVNGIENQALKSDLKTILKIMTTLSLIIKDFIQKNNPDGLYIEASNKNLDLLTGKQQKSYLYQAYLDKQIQTITNYNVYTNRDGFNVTKKTKMKKLEKIIKEAILEVIKEETFAGKNSISDLKKDPGFSSLKPDAKINAEKELEQGGSVTLENNVNEMARIPVQYKIADLSKLDDLSDKVKNSKGVQGIISYLQDKGQAPVAQIAKDQFNRPQQAINPVVLALTQAGVLDTVGGSGVAASRVGKGGEVAPPTTKQIIDPEDFLIGGGEKFDKAPNEPSEEEIAASFAAARAIGDEDEDIIKTLPKDAPKIKPTISDEDYDKLMKFLNAKERLRNIDSALRQNKKISRGGDDMISKDTNEEERLKAKKAELEKRIEDLVASSEYLQRRKAPEDKNK